jgi:hypothetical protein
MGGRACAQANQIDKLSSRAHLSLGLASSVVCMAQPPDARPISSEHFLSASYCPLAQRYSILAVWPSMYPNAPRPRRKPFHWTSGSCRCRVRGVCDCRCLQIEHTNASLTARGGEPARVSLAVPVVAQPPRCCVSSPARPAS